MTNAHLSEADVRRLIEPLRLIAAIESAFRDRYPLVAITPRPSLHLSNGVFFAMSCYDPSGPALGMKLVTVRKNVASGDRVNATYLLLDPETGAPRLTIAANYLTDVRTAATSAVATKFLARPDPATLGIFGTGRLAHAHLAVLPLVRNFQRVLVCGRSPSRAEEFVQQVAREMPKLSISTTDARTCAAESDVICTCTSSPTPVFDGHDVRPRTHLNLVGAFQSHTREADTHIIQRARVIVDTYEAAKSEMGDLLIPAQEGAIPLDHAASDLHELVSGTKRGRHNPDEITVFKSVGCALEDLVAAELLMDANQ